MFVVEDRVGSMKLSSFLCIYLFFILFTYLFIYLLTFKKCYAVKQLLYYFFVFSN